MELKKFSLKWKVESGIAVEIKNVELRIDFAQTAQTEQQAIQ